MTRPLFAASAALGSVLALLALAGCPPELTGTPCNHSSDCPNQQKCLVGHCGYSSGSGGTSGGTGGATSSGGGSSGGRTTGGTSGTGGGNGGDQRIDGVVALNSGFAKPDVNAAWVWAWDHQPANASGTVDTPQALVQTADDGSFRFDGLTSGKSYYLLAQYDLDRDGDQADPTNPKADAYWFVPNPVTLGSSVEIDVPTSGCFVASLTDAFGSSFISELVASVKNVNDGSQITNATVSATDPGTNPQSFSMTYRTGTVQPELDNKYSWTPDGGGFISTIKAVSGTYRFNISAPQDYGYRAGACTVDHHPLASAPSQLTFMPMGPVGGFPTSVSWVSAPLTKEDDIYMEVKGFDISTQSQSTVPCYAAKLVTSPVTIPQSCSHAVVNFMPTSLEVQVLSLRQVNQPLITPQGVSIEGGIVTGSAPICAGC